MFCKIVKDSVHGFIEISNLLILKIISHHYFELLKFIKQISLNFIIYSGTNYICFYHIEAMYLMKIAFTQIIKIKMSSN